MTQQPPDRLDRIEVSLQQTLQIAQSNARAIQAMIDDTVEFKQTIEQDRQCAEAERQELRAATVRLAEVAEGTAN